MTQHIAPTGEQQVRLDEWRNHLRSRLEENHVPEHLREGLVEYLAARRPTGSFLRAMLANDLMQAIMRADRVLTIEHVRSVLHFLSQSAPSIAWGSDATVTTWLATPEPPTPTFD